MTQRKMHLALHALILLFAALTFSKVVHAQPVPPADQAPSAAPASPQASPSGADYPSMLAECDRQLEACKTDAVGVPYLGAAYLALFLVLAGFLLLVRRSQTRLRADVRELRERIAALQGERP